jgi:hypothetical protein
VAVSASRLVEAAEAASMIIQMGMEGPLVEGVVGIAIATVLEEI